MNRLIVFLTLLVAAGAAKSDIDPSELKVDVHRTGHVYALAARFHSSLSKCAAYRYLTDYEAKGLPGVVESNAVRRSSDTVTVDRVADEQVLFLRVRLRSKMEYKELPIDGVEFTQLSGDSKRFEGRWHIEPHPQGSILSFQGLWEPDTAIPLFVLDHFAKNSLAERFEAIARLAEQNKTVLSKDCAG